MKKILLIVGSAPCLREDLAAFHALVASGAYDVMAIGLDTAEYPGRIDHVATYHSYELPQFYMRREAIGGNQDYEIHSQEQYRIWVNRLWPYDPPSGSSAMLGVEAGMGMGYEKIILAGCPLSGRYDEFHPGWKVRYETIKDHVRSLSGWTKELLGAPTEEWLNA